MRTHEIMMSGMRMMTLVKLTKHRVTVLGKWSFVMEITENGWNAHQKWVKSTLKCTVKWSWDCWEGGLGLAEICWWPSWYCGWWHWLGLVRKCSRGCFSEAESPYSERHRKQKQALLCVCLMYHCQGSHIK